MRPRRGWGQGQLTCEAEIRETSCRPVRSEDETLAGAPLCSLMLTFLSLSTREIALGEVLPGRQGGREGKGEEGEGSCPQHQAPGCPAPPALEPPRLLPKVLAHQLAGYGRQGWKPQARLHCGAGWRQPPWAGQGAGPGSPTPGAAPSSPLARVLAAPGPRPRGFGLHPVGMIREPWSTLQDRGAPGSGTPSGSEQGRQAGAGVCLRNPLVPPPPHKAGSLRDPEMPPDHTAQRKHKATQLPRRKLDLGGRGRSLCPGLVGPGITAGRTDAPGWPTDLGSPPPPCTEGSLLLPNTARQVLRGQGKSYKAS